MEYYSEKELSGRDEIILRYLYFLFESYGEEKQRELRRGCRSSIQLANIQWHREIQEKRGENLLFPPEPLASYYRDGYPDDQGKQLEMISDCVATLIDGLRHPDRTWVWRFFAVDEAIWIALTVWVGGQRKHAGLITTIQDKQAKYLPLGEIGNKVSEAAENLIKWHDGFITKSTDLAPEKTLATKALPSEDEFPRCKIWGKVIEGCDGRVGNGGMCGYKKDE